MLDKLIAFVMIVGLVVVAITVWWLWIPLTIAGIAYLIIEDRNNEDSTIDSRRDES